MVTRYCWNAHNEQGDCSFWGHSHNVDFPWETADIYCQFWALLQNGPFSNLSAKRLGSRERRNIQDLSSCFPRRKNTRGWPLSLSIFVFPRRKNTRGWPLPSWSTSLTSTTTADTWLVEFFQPAKLARVWRTPGRSKCSVSKRAWSPLYRKNQPLARKPTREQYFPQMRPKSRCV